MFAKYPLNTNCRLCTFRFINVKQSEIISIFRELIKSWCSQILQCYQQNKESSVPCLHEVTTLVFIWKMCDDHHSLSQDDKVTCCIFSKSRQGLWIFWGLGVERCRLLGDLWPGSASAMSPGSSPPVSPLSWRAGSEQYSTGRSRRRGRKAPDGLWPESRLCCLGGPGDMWNSLGGGDWDLRGLYTSKGGDVQNWTGV